MTYASDWLLETSARHRGHPFAAIPQLHNQHLLLRLKVKVTIRPTEMMAKATGVPPHVMQMNLMTLLELCQTTLLRVNEQAEVVRQTIFDAMEQRALENGHISRHQIVTIHTIFSLEIFISVLSVRPFFSESAPEVVSHPPWWIRSDPVAVGRVLCTLSLLLLCPPCPP